MLALDAVNVYVLSCMLLRVKDLCISFRDASGEYVEAVSNVCFSLNTRNTLAIVGESGSGKTVTALSLMKLLPQAPICKVTGQISLDEGENILELTEKQIRHFRGNGIAYIFQAPSTSLNPSLTIGFQIKEAVKLHQPEVKTKEVTYQLLKKVGLDPTTCYRAYPFELSGGMQQRAMIAMALACKPKILVADEPTTALDVTLQKQIIDLLKTLKRSENLSIILITHNLSLVKDFADNVLVMFRGKIVEQGSTEQILNQPQHVYTKALLQCVPSLKHPQTRLKTIEDYQIE